MGRRCFFGFRFSGLGLVLPLTLFKEREESASVFGGYWLLVLVFYPLEGISFSSAGVLFGHRSSLCLVGFWILHEIMPSEGFRGQSCVLGIPSYGEGVPVIGHSEGVLQCALNFCSLVTETKKITKLQDLLSFYSLPQ